MAGLRGASWVAAAAKAACSDDQALASKASLAKQRADFLQDVQCEATDKESKASCATEVECQFCGKSSTQARPGPRAWQLCCFLVSKARVSVVFTS